MALSNMSSFVTDKNGHLAEVTTLYSKVASCDYNFEIDQIGHFTKRVNLPSCSLKFQSLNN